MYEGFEAGHFVVSVFAFPDRLAEAARAALAVLQSPGQLPFLDREVEAAKRVVAEREKRDRRGRGYLAGKLRRLPTGESGAWLEEDRSRSSRRCRRTTCRRRGAHSPRSRTRPVRRDWHLRGPHGTGRGAARRRRAAAAPRRAGAAERGPRRRRGPDQPAGRAGDRQPGAGAGACSCERDGFLGLSVAGLPVVCFVQAGPMPALSALCAVRAGSTRGTARARGEGPCRCSARAF
ncbi:unnamed protein product [Prorocentrum cordatum]|uniref:Uncharacterized protein n=1 Tax=Prorocentrum cordatum TaxID=2364126 RepID=A0ABN9TYT4_9DINO|nr:unnamed protein product [Polarella glacialis]